MSRRRRMNAVASRPAIVRAGAGEDRRPPVFGKSGSQSAASCEFPLCVPPSLGTGFTGRVEPTAAELAPTAQQRDVGGSANGDGTEAATAASHELPAPGEAPPENIEPPPLTATDGDDTETDGLVDAISAILTTGATPAEPGRCACGRRAMGAVPELDGLLLCPRCRKHYNLMLETKAPAPPWPLPATMADNLIEELHAEAIEAARRILENPS